MKRPTKGAPDTALEGYRGHRSGSNKGIVHETFDEQGREEAIATGIKLGLKPSTVRAWCAYWNRDNKPAATTKAEKPAAKEKSKPAAKKGANLRVVKGGRKAAA